MKTKEQQQQEIKEYVQKWIEGQAADTFVKNEHGVYLYSAGAVSINLRVYFESLLEDFLEDNIQAEKYKV